jgi:hypothetical protein
MRSDPNVVQFWKIVQACLVELYGISEEDAADRIARLTKGGRSFSRPGDLIYHAQPIHVASDLAEKPMPASDVFWRSYQKLLQRHGISQQQENAEVVNPKLGFKRVEQEEKIVRRIKRVAPEKLSAAH